MGIYVCVWILLFLNPIYFFLFDNLESQNKRFSFHLFIYFGWNSKNSLTKNIIMGLGLLLKNICFDIYESLWM